MSGDNGTPGLRPRRLADAPTDTAEPTTPGLGRRTTALLSSAWTAVRPTRRRGTGYIAIGAVGALVGTSIALGVGASGSTPALSEVGAWLGSSEKGTASHANGLTGEVDGKVDLPTGKNPVSISQDGKTVLVLDERTGRVIRVDPAQLTAEHSTDYRSSDLQLVAGGSFAFVVNPVEGTVQRIDPVRTTPIGGKVDLGVVPLGEATVDPTGVLWVPEPTKGRVVPFTGGRPGKPVDVAKPGNNLELTLANGQPVVTDTSAGRITVLDVSGPGMTYNLPSYIGKATPASVLVPDATESNLIPVLDNETGKMAVFDLGTRRTVTAVLGGRSGDFGAPQALGLKVYVPDESNGTLVVYDTDQGTVEQPVKVTDEPGELEMFVRNGLLWVNDEDNAAAAVINADGDVNPIGKYKDKVPSQKKPKDEPPARDNVPDEPSPPVSQEPEPPAAPQESEQPRKPKESKAPPATPKPKKPLDPCEADPASCGVAPPPMPPGTPQAQATGGGITVTFSPGAGLKPTHYTLAGDPGVGSVTPAQVGPDGPFTFQVGGDLSCAQEYAFTVVAHFEGGTTKESQPSPAVRPCTAPSAPSGLQVTVPSGGHGGNLTWQAPSDASGTVTYTVNWGAGSATTNNTNFTITGLTNSQVYNVSVSSSNEAGGGASASGTLDLTPPTTTMNIVDNRNDGQPVKMRADATVSSAQVGSIPSGWNGAVTVHCTKKGDSVTYPGDTATTDVWSRITYNGTTGFISDLWLEARRNSSVWSCQ